MTLDDLERPVSKCMFSELAIHKNEDMRHTVSNEKVGNDSSFGQYKVYANSCM